MCAYTAHTLIYRYQSSVAGCVQVIDALNATQAELGCTYHALLGQLDPPQWQSDLIASRYPTLQAADTSESASVPTPAAQVKSSHSTATLAQAAAALHGLPATRQPASADVFSCMQSMGSILELVSALVAAPGVMHLVGLDHMGTLASVLNKLMPVVAGHGRSKVQTLMGVIRGRDEALAQRIEQEGCQERHSCLLTLLYTAWKVM